MLRKALGYILNILAQCIKGSGKTDWKRVKDFKKKQMESIMMGNSITAAKVETASAKILMAIYIKDNGRKTKDGAQELSVITKGKTMLDSGRMICKRGTELWISPAEQNTKGYSLQERNREKGCKFIAMDPSTKDILKTTCIMDSGSFINQMEILTAASIIWASVKGQVSSIKNLPLLNPTKGISNMTWNGDTESIAGTQAVSIKDSSNEI